MNKDIFSINLVFLQIVVLHVSTCCNSCSINSLSRITSIFTSWVPVLHTGKNSVHGSKCPQCTRIPWIGLVFSFSSYSQFGYQDFFYFFYNIILQSSSRLLLKAKILFGIGRFGALSRTFV